jgi:Bacteriophage T4-like portal protein (Gp20)
MASFEIFGYQIGKKSKQEEELTQAKSFAPPNAGDGAMVVSEGNFYGTVFDVNGGLGSEADLITKYREMALYPDVEYAVDDIVNEAITLEDGKDVVSFNMDNFEDSSVFSKAPVQKKVTQEFHRIVELLDLNNSAYEVFKRWYVDGRLNYHVIPAKNPKLDGILELRYVDPRKVRKVKSASPYFRLLMSITCTQAWGLEKVLMITSTKN